MTPIKISVSLPAEVEITPEEIGRAIFQHLANKLGINDDAGCDWLVDELDKFACIGDQEWIVSIQPNDIALVKAANILLYGRSLKIKREG